MGGGGGGRVRLSEGLQIFVKELQSLKAGVHLKVFTPLKIGSAEISRSRFKQYKNPMLTHYTN